MDEEENEGESEGGARDIDGDEDMDAVLKDLECSDEDVIDDDSPKAACGGTVNNADVDKKVRVIKPQVLSMTATATKNKGGELSDEDFKSQYDDGLSDIVDELTKENGSHSKNTESETIDQEPAFLAQIA